MAVLSLAMALVSLPAAVSPTPALADDATSPEWFPVRTSGGVSVKIGCTYLNCEGGTYHPRWALDIAAPEGTPVFASGGGTATVEDPADAKCNGNAKSVTISHSDGTRTFYTHFSKVVISSGPVQANAMIGLIGSTGTVTPCTFPHLHFERWDAKGGRITPGQLLACHGGKQATYPAALGKTWTQVVHGTPVQHDGLACKWNGKIIRRSGDQVSWVVRSGVRYHIPNYSTDVCASYVKRLPQVTLTDEQIKAELPTEATEKYACPLHNVILRASDWSEPRPSFEFRRDARYSIPDEQTFRFLRLGLAQPLADVPYRVITDSRITAGGIEPRKLYAPDQEGRILRRTDGISWVVVNGRRRHIPDHATHVCAQYHERRTVLGGLVLSQTDSIPEEDVKALCDLNGKILRAADQTDPKPAWTYRDSKKWTVPDGFTYDFFVRAGYPVVDMPKSAITDSRLVKGGTESPKLHPDSIPPNTIIRRTDGVSWVVDSNKVRHHIPFIQDDVCWRNLGGRGFGPLRVSATGLQPEQVDVLRESDVWPCIIGERVVKSSDNSSHFVDKANFRRAIPDGETFTVLSRSYPVVGPWSATDVNNLTPGDPMPHRLDPDTVRNSIVCRDDNVCWAVDGNAARHHIPTYADNVCWRWVNGWRVSRSGVNGAQAASLEELEPWGCNMNGRVVATNEGPSYYMDGNTKRPIVDGHDFACYQYWAGRAGLATVRGISNGEMGPIPQGHAMPMCFDPAHPKIAIWSNANGKYVTAEFGYGGADYGMLRARSAGVGGAWEVFRLIGDCYGGWCAMQSSATRQYVTAEAGYQGYAWGELRARSAGTGSWEQFHFEGDCSTGCGIRAQANNRLVSNEMAFTGAGANMLRARSESIGGWERFRIVYL